jgi:small conductance mechanosensitive channel
VALRSQRHVVLCFKKNVMGIEHWTDIIIKKLQDWLTTTISMLPNLTIAVIVMTIAYFIAKFVRRIAERIVLRIVKSNAASSLVGIILQVAIMFVALTLSLQVLQLDKAVSSILAGIGIIGLALGFAFQDLTANFIAGVYMAFRRPLEIGERVETNGFIGTVERVELRTTTLRTLAGLNVTIPNKDIFQKPIINYTRSANRRVELDFLVPNTFDLDVIEQQLHQAVEDSEDGMSITDVRIYFVNIEDPKIKLHVSFRIESADPRPFMNARHRAIKAIYKLFAARGIVKLTPITP